MLEWIDVKDDRPEEYVSVLGYMPYMKPFPVVRECYRVGEGYYFPALCDFYEINKWAKMPEPDADGEPKMEYRWKRIKALGGTWFECPNCHVIGSPDWKRCPVCEVKINLEE